jgi:hypothetical protein
VQKQTLVEEGTQFKGSIDSDCRVVVNGRLVGEVTGPALHVSSTGEVSGKVRVRELHSEGVLEGEFEAETACLSGVVKDKTVIRAASLDVRLKPTQGALELVFGECEIDVGDVPSKEEALAAATSAAVEQPEPATTSLTTGNGSTTTTPGDDTLTPPN